jgi:hypothetical protein
MKACNCQQGQHRGNLRLWQKSSFAESATFRKSGVIARSIAGFARVYLTSVCAKMASTIASPAAKLVTCTRNIELWRFSELVQPPVFFAPV